MSHNPSPGTSPPTAFLQLQQGLSAKPNLDERCVMHRALALLADKWTLLALMALMQGTKRHGELRQQLRGISTKMLTQTLKLLVDYGMVARTSYPEVPPRVEYALTEFGRSTAPPLLALFHWSVEWQPTLDRLYDERHRVTDHTASPAGLHPLGG